jgi:alkyl hydroperoxide reductase subunit AhpC
MTTTLKPEVQELLNKQHTVRIGDKAPNFDADTQLGRINLYDYLGDSWGVIFSHPRDFTPVCTTELGRVAQLGAEWKKRNIKPLALSVDSVPHHSEWIKDINDINQCTVNYPIIADEDYKVSILYGMLDQTHLSQAGMPFTVRNVFIIDPQRTVRLILSYPASTGRNFDEILRVIDSLQLANSHKVATPADWVKGKETVVLPTVSTDDAKKLFPKGINEVRPWLRTTPDPTAA